MAASLDGSFNFTITAGGETFGYTCTVSGGGSSISIVSSGGTPTQVDSNTVCVCSSAAEVGTKFKFTSTGSAGSVVTTGFQSITPTFEDGVVHFGGFTQTYYSP